MTVSFVRIDDRMIHGQTVTRWAKEYPCDGLIAVNDAAASNKVLTQAYKGASDKKTFVWTVDAFGKKSQKVLDSDTKYFVITKNPIDMKKLLVDQGFVPSDVKEIIAPLVYIVPLQLIAYYITLEKGHDPDKPKNLAKCVTVE